MSTRGLENALDEDYELGLATNTPRAGSTWGARYRFGGR